MPTTTPTFVSTPGLEALNDHFAALSKGWSKQIAASAGVQRMIEQAFAPLHESVAKMTRSWAPQVEVTRAANLVAAKMAQDVVLENANWQRAIAEMNRPTLEALDLIASSWSSDWVAGLVPSQTPLDHVGAEDGIEAAEDIVEPIDESTRSELVTQRQVDRLMLQLFAYTYVLMMLTYVWLEHPQLFAALGELLVGKDAIRLSSNPINSVVNRCLPDE